MSAQSDRYETKSGVKIDWRSIPCSNLYPSRRRCKTSHGLLHRCRSLKRRNRIHQLGCSEQMFTCQRKRQDHFLHSEYCHWRRHLLQARRHYYSQRSDCWLNLVFDGQLHNRNFPCSVQQRRFLHCYQQIRKLVSLTVPEFSLPFETT